MIKGAISAFLLFASIFMAITQPVWCQIDTGGKSPYEAAQRTRTINPTMVLLRSAIVPGWGQYYNRKYIKGSVMAIGEGYLMYGIYTKWKDSNRHKTNFQRTVDPIYKASEFSLYEKSRDSRNLKMWLLAATIFYSMFDAYVDAQLADFDQTDKAYEVFIAPVGHDGIGMAMTLNIK